MGYYEILDILLKQLEEIETQHEYIKKKREIAIQTQDLAEELDLNIRSVRQVIMKMKKRGEIETIKGLLDTTERYYILSEKYLDTIKKWKKR